VNVSRSLRRAALSFLPASQRARLRRWYERTTASGPAAAASFSDDGEIVTMSVESGPRLLVLPECRADLECHLKSVDHAAELAAFLRHSGRPGVLFDVGANNGFFSLLYCLMHPSNRAVAYEPSPIFSERIRRMAHLNGVGRRLDIVTSAVSSKPGPCELFLDERCGFVQTAPFEGTAHDAWRRVSMEATTLDIEARRVGPPTLVKIDVEGYEPEVLEGGSVLLQEAGPVVFLELHLNYLEQRGISPEQALRSLTSRGYAFFIASGRPVSERQVARSWAAIIHLIATPAPG
jgi:FkbM family methyltransferase